MLLVAPVLGGIKFPRILYPPLPNLSRDWCGSLISSNVIQNHLPFKTYITHYLGGGGGKREIFKEWQTGSMGGNWVTSRTFCKKTKGRKNVLTIYKSYTIAEECSANHYGSKQ